VPELDHVDLVVTDLERSLAFYRGLLRPLGWTDEGRIFYDPDGIKLELVYKPAR
jgi:predicted enzyme related to lactoylglutathione lyase